MIAMPKDKGTLHRIGEKKSGRTVSPAFVLCNAPGLLLFYFLLNVVNGFDGFDY